MTDQTIDSVSEGIYHNLITSIVQDIVSQEYARFQLITSRYPDLKPYHRDDTGTYDINGLPKKQESSRYFSCKNCGREVSANRFAAHLQRCLERGGGRH